MADGKGRAKRAPGLRRSCGSAATRRSAKAAALADGPQGRGLAKDQSLSFTGPPPLVERPVDMADPRGSRRSEAAEQLCKTGHRKRGGGWPLPIKDRRMGQTLGASSGLGGSTPGRRRPVAAFDVDPRAIGTGRHLTGGRGRKRTTWQTPSPDAAGDGAGLAPRAGVTRPPAQGPAVRGPRSRAFVSRHKTRRPGKDRPSGSPGAFARAAPDFRHSGISTPHGPALPRRYPEGGRPKPSPPPWPHSSAPPGPGGPHRC